MATRTPRWNAAVARGIPRDAAASSLPIGSPRRVTSASRSRRTGSASALATADATADGSGAAFMRPSYL